jgi:hypothetical protein
VGGHALAWGDKVGIILILLIIRGYPGVSEAWFRDGEAVRGMAYDELVSRLEPLIYKYSRWNIPGYTQEDLAQEIKLIIFLCQDHYHPDKHVGYAGRTSGFLNFLITSIEHRFLKLKRSAMKFYKPLTKLRCVRCGNEIWPIARAVCSCGGRRWERVFDGSTVSMTNLVTDPCVTPEWPVEEYEFLSGLSAPSRSAAAQLLSGYNIDRKQRRMLRQELRSRGGTRWQV